MNNKTVFSKEEVQRIKKQWQDDDGAASVTDLIQMAGQALLQSPEIQQLRKEAEVCKAIELACERLPLDCDIRIELERDAGTVVLFVDGDRVDFPSDHESMDMAIRDAIDAAMETKP